jgi:hypothetical protein
MSNNSTFRRNTFPAEPKNMPSSKPERRGNRPSVLHDPESECDIFLETLGSSSQKVLRNEGHGAHLDLALG